jgi:diguanylate cyclase (GGDEF)-like protein/PAS domain S-box-containing protein
MFKRKINNKIILSLAMLMFGISIAITIYSGMLVKQAFQQQKRTHQLLNLSRGLQMTKFDDIFPSKLSPDVIDGSEDVRKWILNHFDQMQRISLAIPEFERPLESAKSSFLSLIAEIDRQLPSKGGLDLLGPGISIGSDVSSRHLYNLMVSTLYEFDVVLHRLSLEQEEHSSSRIKVFGISILVSLFLGILLLLCANKTLQANNVESRKDADNKLRASIMELNQQKYALDQHSIVAVTDIQGRITYVNSKFCDISGYTEDELLGRDHVMLNSGLHPKGFFKEMYRTVAQGQTWHNEVCNRAKDGHLYWVETTVVPFMDQQGKPQCYISIRTDITDRRAADERNYILAFHDQLTALPNRRLFLQKLSDTIKASKRNDHKSALLFLDIDDFKTLNDSRGHLVGDMFLQELANRLKEAIREDDIVARIGGDEFVILLGNLDKDFLKLVGQIEVVSEKILSVINKPFQLYDLTYYSSVSVGVTIVDGPLTSEVEILKQADIAMYQAKNSGKNQVRFFDPEMQAAIEKRMQLEMDMQIALKEQQFLLYYQLQVDTSGLPIGAEALIRWIHPERGMISPADFIPIAEDTGMIVQIGDWVLDAACAQLAIWKASDLTKDLSLAINVSAKQFNVESFVEDVKESMSRHNVDAAKLKIELTEGALVDRVDEVVMRMQMLNSINVQFALDDFGTGYSSLQYLKRLPLNQLKIDQSFVSDITKANNGKIVRTIIAMAKELDLVTIAEGVETDLQWSYLRQYGCNYYQGYHFARPLPITEFESLIEKQSVNHH